MKRVNLNNLFIGFLGLCATVAILTGLGIIYYLFVTIQKLRDSSFTVDNDTLGMIGEFLGGTVGAIWALAGVILFYLALIYQRRELELQRQELKETREILEIQSDTIAIQQFDNTFFKLLEFHIEASRKIQLTGNQNGFDELYKDFISQIKQVKRKRKIDRSAKMLNDEIYGNCFQSVYNGYKNTLQLYFESYKTMVHFILEKSHDPTFYFNVIKTHWSEQELIIQFYYILFYTEDKSLKSIVEKYGLFQGLNQRYITEIDRLHLEKVKASAFLPAKRSKNRTILNE